MLKRMIWAGMSLPLFYGQMSFAENQTTLPPTGSHFNFSVAGPTLSVTTRTHNRFYPNAGIQILTPGVTVSGNVQATGDGTYLFAVSDTAPAQINMLGNGGSITFKICLNGVGKKYSCEKHTQSGFASTHFIFATSNTFSGNLGGVAGADAICQTAAYSAGSIVPFPGLTFKALLVTSTRYPCSSINGGVSGSCGGSFSRGWPLVSATSYKSVTGDFYNTVNQNGVFNGSNPKIFDERGVYNDGQFTWAGIQSILSNSTGSDIVGWAYSDMNSAADAVVYAANLASCNDFTSASAGVNGSIGTIGKIAFVVGVAPSSTWGNYFFFDNTQTSFVGNVFSASNHQTCDLQSSLICVS